jgi:hypothetical protein
LFLKRVRFYIYLRDNSVCVYCGLDEKKWPNWLFLSVDHLLSKKNPNRENVDYKVTACRFCNGVCNRTKYDTESKKPEEIINLKKAVIKKVIDEYKEFFDKNVNIK